VLLAAFCGVGMLALSEPAVTHALGTTATYYHPSLHGLLMANGEPYNRWDPGIAACNWYPLGTVLRVTRQETGAELYVRVKDRGSRQLTLDLSEAGFAQLGILPEGRIAVWIEVVPALDDLPGTPPGPAVPAAVAESIEPDEALSAAEAAVHHALTQLEAPLEAARVAGVHREAVGALSFQPSPLEATSLAAAHRELLGASSLLPSPLEATHPEATHREAVASPSFQPSPLETLEPGSVRVHPSLGRSPRHLAW